MKMQNASQYRETVGVILQPTTSETITGGFSSDAAVRPVTPTIQDVLKSPWLQTRMLVLYDILIASLSVLSGFWLTPYYGAESGRTAYLSLHDMIPVLAASFVLASLAAGLYERRYIKSPLSAFVGAPVAAAGEYSSRYHYLRGPSLFEYCTQGHSLLQDAEFKLIFRRERLIIRPKVHAPWPLGILNTQYPPNQTSCFIYLNLRILTCIQHDATSRWSFGCVFGPHETKVWPAF